MFQAQIAEYESLREEAMRNMEMRGNLTNAMAVALAALFGLSSWFPTAYAFYVFFFVPSLAAMWGYFIYHAYEVHLALQRYLLTLESRLGLGWTKAKPPKPVLRGYTLVLVGIIAASLYFISVLQSRHVLSLDFLVMVGWSFWCIGAVSTWCVGVEFWDLDHRFSNFEKEIDQFREKTATGRA